ncbi:hypothetical protein KEM52_003939, partial [Ascosphaera acerosa]
SGSRSRSRSRSPSPSPSALRVHPTTTNNTASTSSFPRTHSLVGSYPRTSFAGSRASLYLNLQAPIADKGVAAGPGSAPPGSSFSSAKTVAVLSDRERSQILRDELALLADNNIGEAGQAGQPGAGHPHPPDIDIDIRSRRRPSATYRHEDYHHRKHPSPPPQHQQRLPRKHRLLLRLLLLLLLRRPHR